MLVEPGLPALMPEAVWKAWDGMRTITEGEGTLSGKNGRISGDFTICTAMSGSGARIGMAIIHLEV